MVDMDAPKPPTPRAVVPDPAVKPLVDPMTPWEQMIGEPHQWYMRFVKYRDLGTRRSVQGAYRMERLDYESRKAKPRQNWRPAYVAPDSWREKAKYWNWKERAEAWDHWLSEETQRISLDRQKQQVEDEWALRTEVLANAKKMLVHPLVKQTVEHEGQTIIIEPVGWNKDTAIRMVDLMTRLGRVAADMGVEVKLKKEEEGEEPKESSSTANYFWLKELSNEPPKQQDKQV